MLVADLNLPREETIQELTEASAHVAERFQEALLNVKTGLGLEAPHGTISSLQPLDLG